MTPPMPLSPTSAPRGTVLGASLVGAPTSPRRYSNQLEPSAQAIVAAQAQRDQAERQAQADQAAADLRLFLEQKEGSTLRAWLRHFDLNNDQRISVPEFRRGMENMRYQGKIDTLFAMLDADRSGELTLEEIDKEQAVVWKSFRQWCLRFAGVDDFFHKIGGYEAVQKEFLEYQQFCEGIVDLGWRGGNEGILFAAFDWNVEGVLRAKHLKWLDVEKRRQNRKELAKKRAMYEAKSKPIVNRTSPQVIMDRFKQFLRKKYGNYIRAWRQGLSPDGNMLLQKPQFLKACSRIGWICDNRILWSAFDKDDSGVISIDELDLRSARILAQFRKYVDERFGSTKAAYLALDKTGRNKMRLPEFSEALRDAGFTEPVKPLFDGLDWDQKGYLCVDDVVFLDKWKPLPFLLAAPNEMAKEEVKAKFLESFKTYLKAWRKILDRDGTNRCNWDEFTAACRYVDYNGDIAGAWRALDTDLSGFITLREMDPQSLDILFEFKHWADEEFGSVKSLFGVFDIDSSGDIAQREFCHSCRIYGFDGNARLIFSALDYEKNGSISLMEMVFLDRWKNVEEQEQMQAEALKKHLGQHSRRRKPPPPLAELPPAEDTRNANEPTEAPEEPAPAEAAEAAEAAHAAPPATKNVAPSSARPRRRGSTQRRLPRSGRGIHDHRLAGLAAVEMLNKSSERLVQERLAAQRMEGSANSSQQADGAEKAWFDTGVYLVPPGSPRAVKRDPLWFAEIVYARPPVGRRPQTVAPLRRPDPQAAGPLPALSIAPGQRQDPTEYVQEFLPTLDELLLMPHQHAQSARSRRSGRSSTEGVDSMAIATCYSAR